MGGAEVCEGCHEEEIGDAGGIDIGVIFHLARHQAFVASGPHEEAPIFIIELIGGDGHGCDGIFESAHACAPVIELLEGVGGRWG